MLVNLSFAGRSLKKVPSPFNPGAFSLRLEKKGGDFPYYFMYGNLSVGERRRICGRREREGGRGLNRIREKRLVECE